MSLLISDDETKLIKTLLLDIDCNSLFTKWRLADSVDDKPLTKEAINECIKKMREIGESTSKIKKILE